MLLISPIDSSNEQNKVGKERSELTLFLILYFHG